MAGGSLRLVLETSGNQEIVLETAVDVQEVRKLDAYLKRLFGNPRIRVVPRPKKDDSAEVYIGEEFIGELFVDDEDDDRSFQFQMAILEDYVVEKGVIILSARAFAPSTGPWHWRRRAIAQASCAENETSGRRRRCG